MVLPSEMSKQTPIKKDDYYLYRGYKIHELDGVWFVEGFPYIYGNLEKAMGDVDMDAWCLYRKIDEIEEETR